MKKWSREQIDEALDMLKVLRKEEAYSGVMPHHFASCYMPAPTYLYDWDKISYEYTCSVCGRAFGDKEAKGKRVRDFDFGSFGGDEETVYDENKIQVETWNVDSVLRSYNELKNLGYDVLLELCCSDCIKQKKAIPIAFKFRAPENTSYTVSYPLIGIADEKRRNGTNRKCFLPHEYHTAISFLKEIPPRKDFVHLNCHTKKKGDLYYVGDVFRDYEIKEKILAEFRKLKFKKIEGSESVEVLHDGSLTSKDFVEQIVSTRTYENEGLHVDLTLERDISLEEACRKWLNQFEAGTTYEGRPWKDIFDAVKGILGLSVEG